MPTSEPGPAVDLIDHAAGIIVAKMREPRTAPYHWAGALWEAGMLCPPGHAVGAVADPTPIPAEAPARLPLAVSDMAHSAAAVASRRWESTPNRYAYVHAEIYRAAWDAAGRAYVAGLAAGRTAAAADPLLTELVRAAEAWRAQFEKPAESKPPRMAALINAVDAIAAARIAENGANQ